MAFSETDINEIIELGKKAVVELKNNNLNKFEEYAEMGFNVFPEDSIKSQFTDLGYRYIKMILKGHLDNKNFGLAKKWLDRLIEFNKKDTFSDGEVGFYCGKYFYETGNFDDAYKQWREVVRQSGKNHKRFFEGEDAKYWEFYTTQKKLHDKK
jgi:tetratricopeptide (TPR) repeat protein